MELGLVNNDCRLSPLFLSPEESLFPFFQSFYPQQLLWPSVLNGSKTFISAFPRPLKKLFQSAQNRERRKRFNAQMDPPTENVQCTHFICYVHFKENGTAEEGGYKHIIKISSGSKYEFLPRNKLIFQISFKFSFCFSGSNLLRGYKWKQCC